MRIVRLATLLAALALAPTATASRDATPSLRFVALIPVKVQGARFFPGERVKVTLRAGTATRARSVRVATHGGFTVLFGRLEERDRCSGAVAVSAVGARGDRAAYRLPTTACPGMTSGPYR